ncbi:head-tail adaptor protein [Sphingomonas sp. PP-CC-3A-396]|uniref:head-tail adaptor protein n=1 Tax=Sphingomonas sp. PP-CC-3A-396 TaxID=2135655 RepID=UPI00105076BA|nr:head-tail adaptor protein [Sphingomonas sp. PP-CC-3A-396]TCQ04108.1 head-tail adaptor [Sphingomonas sp. PP-CC-3A-396]
MTQLTAGEIPDFIRIERPVADTSLTGAGSGTWELVDEVWASVVDMLPSRGEKLAEGINVATRPARVRMRARDDITASMRFVMGSRIMQITAGPAVIRQRSGIEFMVEDYSVAGNAA